jgi:hypothetical protein
MTPWLVSCYMGFNNGIRFFAEKAVNMNATDTVSPILTDMYPKSTSDLSNRVVTMPF